MGTEYWGEGENTLHVKCKVKRDYVTGELAHLTYQCVPGSILAEVLRRVILAVESSSRALAGSR